MPFASWQFATTYELMSRDEVFGTLWRGASNSIAYFLILVMMPLLGLALRRGDLTWPRYAGTGDGRNPTSWRLAPHGGTPAWYSPRIWAARWNLGT